mgnify:CR=1 FL=1
MKIILFDGSFNTTTFINRLAKGLVKNHEVYIMGFNEKLDCQIKNIHYVPLGSNQNFWRLINVSFKYAYKKKKIKNIFNVLRMLFFKEKKNLQKQNLSVALSSIQPDIIHLQWLSNISIFEEFLINNTYKIVLSQRGFHVNVRPFVDKENMVYLKKWYPKISGFHSVSKAIKEVSNKVYSSNKKIDKVVYSGLDFNEFEFNTAFEKSEILKIVSVGRNHWKKGYRFAIHAMSILKEKGVKFQYTIIGVKETEELSFMLNQFGLKNVVVFIDKIPHVDVYKRMKASDILLLPSLEEGIANVCIEAMALGVPVISTNCGGMEELISNDKEGFIVPIRNPNAIAEKILKVKSLSNLELSKICNNALIKVKQQHNENLMVKGIESLYNLVHERD